MFNDLCSYDRKAKAYILRPANGEVYEFPSGPKGKMEAYRFWLSIEYPAYYAIATQLSEANPHAERIIWKAIEIAVNPDMIDPVNQDELIAMVQSSNDPYGRYLISAADATAEEPYLLCNCPAYLELTPVWLMLDDEDSAMQVCKHSLAVWMRNRVTPAPAEDPQTILELEPILA